MSKTKEAGARADASGHVSGEIVGLELDLARKLKWNRGRAEHGSIMLRDPLVELLHEFLDAMNYSRILASDGRFSESERLYFLRTYMDLKAKAGVIQTIWRGDQHRPYTPTEFPFA